MTALAAEHFIKQIVGDNQLRTFLYTFDNFGERMQYIAEKGYSFKYPEFEDGINHLKMESPHKEQADMLDELYMWWQMLNDDRTEAEFAATACSPSACASCHSSCHM